jgi:hypothetical protein
MLIFLAHVEKKKRGRGGDDEILLKRPSQHFFPHLSIRA